jgi:hypothetical protein
MRVDKTTRALSGLALKSVETGEAVLADADGALTQALAILDAAEALHAVVSRVYADPGASSLSVETRAAVADWHRAPVSSVRPRVVALQADLAARRAELVASITDVASLMDQADV